MMQTLPINSMKLRDGHIHSYLNYCNKIHRHPPFKNKSDVTTNHYQIKPFIEQSVQTLPEVLLCSADTLSWIPPLKPNLYKLYLRKISKQFLAHNHMKFLLIKAKDLPELIPVWVLFPEDMI